MKNRKLCVIALLGVAVIFMSCQFGGDFLLSNMDNTLTGKSLLLETGSDLCLPVGSNILSASFYIYAEAVWSPSYPVGVKLHKISSPWDEATTTWNTFNGAFDSQIEDQFLVPSPGWLTFDVTGLVQEWVEEETENYGMLMEQGLDYLVNFLSGYFSSEYEAQPDKQPYLEIEFAYSGSTVSVVLNSGNTSVSDTYIWENLPDDVFGESIYLFTGVLEGFEKYTLIRFDIPLCYDPGYTRTIGYWKTHCGFGPQEDVVSTFLPLLLGEAGGVDTQVVSTNSEAYSIFNTKDYGGGSNGIAKLYAQLLAAKLNLANGADGTAIWETVAAADAFLAVTSWMEWSSLQKCDKKMVLSWMDTLDQYNNGLLGPSHYPD
jgi:hypothetical protein